MDAAAARGAYADARWVERSSERLEVVNGEVEEAADADEAGVGVRVRAGSGWGFAATGEVSRSGAQAALARALAMAEATGGAAGATGLAAAAPARGAWRAPFEVDPFAIALEEKLGVLLAADEAMRGDARIVRRTATCFAQRTTQAFASTEGAACEQTVVECGGGLAAWAVQDGELQVRSAPMAHGGHVAQAGWEHVAALDLVARAPGVAEEAVALLSAPPCRSGRTTVILGGEQLALQVHESIGHALELDRMLGLELAYAGGSWVAPDDLGSLRYGSDALHVTADATQPSGLGTFGWDDEGVAAMRTDLIAEGVLRGALASRESAAAAGLPASNGCMRADGPARQPLVRMTNVSIEPGDGGTLEELIGGVREGVLLESNRSWSIDDRRLHFQFACEVGREIRDGRLGRLVRNPSYAGVTPRFWAGLRAVCGPSEWELWGLTNCGKGEPGQFAHVSHGAAPARFDDVEVGAP